MKACKMIGKNVKAERNINMRIYKFPFEKIEKDNARIVLYGMGEVGKQYLAQCMSTDTIRVLFAVDGHSELSYVKMHDVQVYNPIRISNLKKDEFDYIVIAMSDEKSAESVRNSLVNGGISREKIVWCIDYYDIRKNLFSPELSVWHNPSFSWFGEDMVVLGLFECMGIEKPSYLDIGCNHPYEGNNTALLYLRGSSGVNIDANPNCIQLMNTERPDDTNVCIGVCGECESCEKEFYMLEEYGALNSFSKKYIEKYEKFHNIGYERTKAIKTQCISLSDVILKYCGGKFPDYFDLDIEGLDDEVIASYDFTDNGPKIICVESHSESVCCQMLTQGYIRYFSTAHNVIYVKKEFIGKVLRV